MMMIIRATRPPAPYIMIFFKDNPNRNTPPVFGFVVGGTAEKLKVMRAWKQTAKHPGRGGGYLVYFSNGYVVCAVFKSVLFTNFFLHGVSK